MLFQDCFKIVSRLLKSCGKAVEKLWKSCGKAVRLSKIAVELGWQVVSLNRGKSREEFSL